MEALQKAIAGLQDKALADQQEKIKKALIEINTKTFEKAQAYTNVIILAGYAGSFTVWTYTRASLPEKANITIALLLGMSLLTFVFWEIFAMCVRARELMRTRPLLAGDMPPEKFFEALKTMQESEQKMQLWLLPIWLVILFITVATAFSAIGLLFYNYIALLIGWPAWPK